MIHHASRSPCLPRPRSGRIAALLILVGSAAAGCSSGDGGVPPELRDRWVAEEGRHAGVTVEITCRRVLVDAPDGFVSHLIMGVEEDAGGDATEYDLELLIDGGGEDHLRLVRRAGEPDALRMSSGGDSRFLRRPEAPVPWGDWGAEDCEDAD